MSETIQDRAARLHELQVGLQRAIGMEDVQMELERLEHRDLGLHEKRQRDAHLARQPLRLHACLLRLVGDQHAGAPEQRAKTTPNEA